MNEAILFLKMTQYGRGIVGGAIIYGNDFEIVEGLLYQR